MSNKGNFSQAMREILGMDNSNKDEIKSEDMYGESNESDDYREEKVAKSKLDRDFNSEFASKEAKKDAIKKESSEPAFFENDEEKTSKNTFSGNFEADSKKFNTNFSNNIPEREEIEEEEVGTTIITKNTIIEGNIKSFENIELNGKVKGTIQTSKNVGICGCVQGNIEATDVLLEGAQIKGDISSKGALLMDKDTTLVGDVDAQNTRVDGKIKGEINVGGNGEFLSNSVVVGNITVSNFYVQYGARMQGYINTNFTKNEEDSIFERIAGN